MTRHRKGRALLWVALCASLAAASVTSAAELKIGFIDSDRILQKYDKTKAAQEDFNRQVSDISKKAKEKKSEIDELQRKLDQQSPMLSEAKRDEQNKQIQAKVSDYEAFVQANWGPNGQISKLNQEALKPIIDRVHNIVTIIGTDEGYSLILDAADGNVVFGDHSYDLTDRVLSDLKTEDDTGTPTRGRTASGQ